MYYSIAALSIGGITWLARKVLTGVSYGAAAMARRTDCRHNGYARTTIGGKSSRRSTLCQFSIATRNATIRIRSTTSTTGQWQY